MIPSTSVTSLPGKIAQTAASPQSDRAHASEAARASAGETAASNVRAETAQAVSAPKQSAAAPRLRDEETSERTARPVLAKDAPAGPPPTFEESPLERQVRVAFDPPEMPVEPEDSAVGFPGDEQADEVIDDAPQPPVDLETAEPPPNKTERAEASFAETREMAEPKEPAQFDVAR